MLNKILAVSSSRRAAQRSEAIHRKVMRDLAEKGGQLFGPIPAGHRREFFCLDKHTWVWHEEWTDQNGQRRIVTTRYDIRPNGILKSQGNSNYQQLSRDELRNLFRAAKAYCNQLSRELGYSNVL